MGAMIGCELDNMEDIMIGLELVRELGEGGTLGLELCEDMSDILGCEQSKWKIL